MKEFFKYFILMQLSVQLVSVVPYTVVLKQVKTLRPSVKVYRYELRQPKLLPDSNGQYVHYKPLLGQRIYPVALKPGKDGNWKARAPPFKKEKPSYYKGAEKGAPRDPRVLGLSQHLVPPVSNQIEDNLEVTEQEDEVRPLIASPQLGKSFSSFGQEKGRVHSVPGEWATPVAQVDSENTTKSEFTPSQLYLQIRHKNTVIHVPQSEALKDAETLEELINAPRLKELARTTHVQETYSEEGYEDAGYDHAGHIRQAQHGEVYDAKDEGRFRIKDPPVILDYDSDLEESKKVPLKNLTGIAKDVENLSNKLEPRITRSRSEVSKTSMEYVKIPKNYKGEHLYSSRVKGPPRDHDGSGKLFNSTSIEPTFPSYFGEMPPTPDSVLSNDSFMYYNPASKYRNSTKIYPVTKSSSSNSFLGANGYTDFKPYISAIDSQASPSAKSLKYSRIYSKKTKQLRLKPFNNGNVYLPPPPPPPPPTPSTNPETPPHEDFQPLPPGEGATEDESADQRIVLPTIGYINSLTTAHFGKNNPKPSQEESKTQLTDALNLTQALDYLRSKKNEKGSPEATKSPTEIDVRTFEPMKLKKSRPPYRSFISKAKREVYLVKTRDRRSETDEYEGNDESDAPHNEKKEEIAEDERKRIEDENLEKEKYEADLREEISRKEEEILKETYKEIGVEKDISEVFPDLGLSDSESELSSESTETTPGPVDVGKYPFYLSKRLPENSALRYATDPKQFPKKSGYKMEFYDSREGVIQCPDFHPDLKDLPNSDNSEYSEDQPGDSQRLAGLGDKIACLRMKYFDPEPFDNPIFKEREIDYVGKPKSRKKILTKSKPKSSGKGFDKQEQTTQKIYNFHQTKHPKPQIGFPVRNNVITQETRDSPSSPLRVVAREQLRLKSPQTEPSRIIPVTEVMDDVPPQPVTAFSNPPVWWKTVYHSHPHPQIHSPSYSKPPQQPQIQRYLKTPPKQLVIPHKCLSNISNLAVLDGTKNLTVDCDDATLFQEIIRNVARLRIIPKTTTGEGKIQRKSSVPFDKSDWIPILGYTAPKHFGKAHELVSRRTDRVTKLKNETSDSTSSNHYVIDELKEEENVRKGEVMDDMDHYMKLLEESEGEEAEVTTVRAETVAESPSRRRRGAPADPEGPGRVAEGDGGGQKDEGGKAAEITKMKRPLARLSGRDFLVRYHRNKGRATTEKTEDFWKVTNIQKPQRKKYADAGKPVNTAETSTKRIEIKAVHDSQPTNSSGEKSGKFIIKQTRAGKNSPLSLISEKITKSPEVSAVEFWKISATPLNFSKIITKVSREVSQSTDKPRIVRKHKETTQTPKAENVETSTAQPEVTQQKTADRNLNPKSVDVVEGPILYYIVNLKSGRGKWITRYEKHRGGNAGKHQKTRKPKEYSGLNRDKGKDKYENQFPS